MTVRYVINIWGCYGSNFEAASKKEVVLVILSLFWSPQNPFMAAKVLVWVRSGSQRCPISQATPSTAQKNSPDQKSRFELI